MSNDATVRSFTMLLRGLEDGQLEGDLTDKCNELSIKLLKQAETLGKAKGELVLKLKFSADPNSVEIFGEIVMKEPKPARVRSVRWFNKDGSLVGDNPKQQKLALKQVPTERAAKEVPAAEPAPRSV